MPALIRFLRHLIGPVLLLQGLLVHAAGEVATQPQPTIRHYDVRLTPDLAAGTLGGQVRLLLAASGGVARRLQLDAGPALFIESVQEAGRALNFERLAQRLIVQLPPAEPATGERSIEIRYRGAPIAGLRFLPQHRQVYTAFSTSQWLPCVDAPDQRATLNLGLELPADLQVVGNGRLVRSELLASGQRLTVWSLAQPMPSYLFGFAAGPFREVVDDSAWPTLRHLGPDSLSQDDLRRIFADTRDMIAFYADKAGLPFPAESYTQVLVSGPAAQELAGFAVMSEAYGRRVLADPQQAWLAAHELSHQWWGNAVTNRDWNEFWLNEGISSFLNAAWFEHRFGVAAYDRLIDAARRKYEAVRESGGDRSLVFPDWAAPSANDRSLVYDKGAYVMHRLRLLMGDTAFWSGLRSHTRKFWGRSVTSREFQDSMQAAAGERDLGPFFDEWVFRKERP